MILINITVMNQSKSNCTLTVRESTALPASPPRPQAMRRTLHSQELFAGAIEITIEHHGEIYRLRQTALGKLILTK